MAGQRSFASDYGGDSSRCQKTNGKRWRCPMPAQPNESFCSHHRAPIIKTPPPSLPQNPSRVSDRRYTGPNVSEEELEHDNLGSDKKRRRRKEMAVSDLVAEKSPDPVDASTKKGGSKKKKTARSAAKRDSLHLDKGEVNLIPEKCDLGLDPVETIKKKRTRTKRRLVDSDDLLDLEAKRESRAESEVEKVDNSSDKAADVIMDSGVEGIARVLDLENGGDPGNQKDKISDVKIGVEMDQLADIDDLDMPDSKINKEKATIGGDMDNFEASSGKGSIIETDSGDKVSENMDLLETNKRKRGMKMKATDLDMKKNHNLDSNMMAEFGGDLVAKSHEMNYAEGVDVEINSGDMGDHILDHLNKNDKSRKKETMSSYIEKANQISEGKLFVLDVQNHESNSDKTAEKTEVEKDLSGGKDDHNLGMLETNKNKERKKVGVLEVQELEKSTDIVAGVEENMQHTSGHESDDVNKRKSIDKDDPEVPKLSQTSDKTTAVGIIVEKDMGLEKPGHILDMFGTDKCSNQPVENSFFNKRSQISRKKGKEISNCNEVDSEGELLNQTLSSFKTNKKRNKKEKKTDIAEESEAEFDPLAHDLMRIAVKRQMEKIKEKIRKEKETEVRKELPNGVMAISPGPISFSSNTVHAFDKKIGLAVGDNFLLQRRFRSKNVEPEPIAVIKKLPMRVSRGEKKGKCVQKSGKTDIRRGTATSISEELTIDQNRSSSIYIDCMISQLRPVLKLLDWEQVLELEIEAKTQGKNLAGVRVQTIEYTQDMQYKCNFCRGLIVNLFRGCSNCCYKLCLSCCQEIRGKNLPKEAEIMTSDYAETHDRIIKEPLSFKIRDEQIPCPPTGLGGCGQEVLIMKLLLPFGLLESVTGGSNSG